jgi:hypothetical protein
MGKIGRAGLLGQEVRDMGLEGCVELVGGGRAFFDGVG